VRIRQEEAVDSIEKQRVEEAAKMLQKPVHQSEPAAAPPITAVPVAPPPPKTPFTRPGQKVGRNDPCPCGSGEKFKQCHGKLE
jgi:preprotein translocase subunit SecA